MRKGKVKKVSDKKRTSFSQNGASVIFFDHSPDFKGGGKKLKEKNQKSALIKKVSTPAGTGTLPVAHSAKPCHKEPFFAHSL